MISQITRMISLNHPSSYIGLYIYINVSVVRGERYERYVRSERYERFEAIGAGDLADELL